MLNYYSKWKPISFLEVSKKYQGDGVGNTLFPIWGMCAAAILSTANLGAKGLSLCLSFLIWRVEESCMRFTFKTHIKQLWELNSLYIEIRLSLHDSSEKLREYFPFISKFYLFCSLTYLTRIRKLSSLTRLLSQATMPFSSFFSQNSSLPSPSRIPLPATTLQTFFFSVH